MFISKVSDLLNTVNKVFSSHSLENPRGSERPHHTQRVSCGRTASRKASEINRPFHGFFQLLTYASFGKIRRHHWKERLKIIKIAKFESNLLKANGDRAPQSCEIFQTFCRDRFRFASRPMRRNNWYFNSFLAHGWRRGSRMALDHSLSLIYSLNSGLKIRLLPPLLCIAFVPSALCAYVFGRL